MKLEFSVETESMLKNLLNKLKRENPSDDTNISAEGFSDLEEKERQELRRAFVFSEENTLPPVERVDVMGLEHALEIIEPYIYYLRNFKELKEKNVEIDGGILAYGPPGTGKTYTARYMANASGAHTVEAKNFPRTKGYFQKDDISELFALCKEYVETNNRPVILFWDEFNPKDWTQEQLNKELDGSQGRAHGVLLVATTNSQPYTYDPALMRPGRIGTHIKFSYPNKDERKELLRYFTLQKNTDENIDFESLSYMVGAGSTATDIKKTVDAAWRNVCMGNIDKSEQELQLSQDDLTYALLEDLWGPPENITLSHEERKRIAIYEVGRAIVARTLEQPTQITSIPKRGRNKAHRTTEFRFEGEIPLEAHKRQISVCFGGIIAQSICGIPANTRGEQDYHRATEHAEKIIERYGEDMQGMSLAGLASTREGLRLATKDGFDPFASVAIKSKIEGLLEKQKTMAEDILNQYTKEDIEKFARQLLDKEYMVQKDIDSIVKPFDIAAAEQQNEMPTGLYL